MRDILDNGIDENCNGSDFTSDTIVEAPDPAYVDDHGLCGEQGCNFILLTIDSLRSDRLGTYNPSSELTPNLDEIAGRGARFDNAYCMGPGTILTVPQLFSVVHDTQLDLDWSRAREIGPRPLRESNLLFPQVLSRAGYNTGGIAGHFYLEPLRYGFERYENERENWAEHRDVTSPGVTERAIAMFDEFRAEDGNFFQWVHYFDPHHDYMAHEPAHESLGDHERYDLEVKFTDAWIGRFVDHVEANSDGRPIVWIITADHGEGLGDHGIRYHNENFYDELCRIPLVITVPGAEPRQIVGPVSLHDIGATVLNLAGLPPEPTFEGRSLVDAISTGAENTDRAVFHQAVYEQGGVDHEIFGVSTSEWRLFWNRLHGTVELYAVSDKREEHNVEASNPQVRAELLETIEGFLHRVE
jgi:arylsulfatase A-like enzyme